MTELQAIPANQIPERFYRGGHRIDDFRGTARGEDFRPEDWIASTTPLAGEASLGLSALADGELLVEAIIRDPEAWLGPKHVAAFGNSTMMLVKLLDAGQRLPVHAHPDDHFARATLHRANGKAEAWYLLSPGEVHIGLRESLSIADLERIVKSQDLPALLGALHTRSVSPGDTVFVPAGELHAIGSGVLLLEIQQPEDLSILLEWEGFRVDGLRDGHLGIGFMTALKAVTTMARSEADVDALIVRGPVEGTTLVADADPYFRIERVVVDGRTVISAGFAVLVGESGDVIARSRQTDEIAMGRGVTAVLPFAAGDITLTGTGSLLVCRPPLSPNA